MDKPIPKIGFILMSLAFKCRDMFRPRKKILDEVDIKPDSNVLDFGCGPGSYIEPVPILVVLSFNGHTGNLLFVPNRSSASKLSSLFAF